MSQSFIALVVQYMSVLTRNISRYGDQSTAILYQHKSLLLFLISQYQEAVFFHLKFPSFHFVIFLWHVNLFLISEKSLCVTLESYIQTESDPKFMVRQFSTAKQRPLWSAKFITWCSCHLWLLQGSEFVKCIPYPNSQSRHKLSQANLPYRHQTQKVSSKRRRRGRAQRVDKRTTTI